MHNSIFSGLLVAALTAVGLNAHAQSWDAGADYQNHLNANPNGVWSYGYDPAAMAGYQFKAFDLAQTTPVTRWVDSTFGNLGAPSFGRNNTSQTISGIAPGQIYLHPGPTANGDAAIVRFSAPASGGYLVDARFFAGDTGETNALLFLNGLTFRNFGSTNGNPAVNGIAVSLSRGDTLDFIVGNLGNFTADSTPLDIRITPVPEPATALLLAAGVAGIGALRRRLLHSGRPEHAQAA